MTEPLIQLLQVQKSFGQEMILQDITLDILPGKIYTIFGPNGCGKSTLMNVITGIAKQDAGQVKTTQALANRVGYVFQDYRRHLLPWLTARQNILFPLQLRGVSQQEQDKAWQELIEIVPPTFDPEQRVFTLSGGQAQLVSMLRALIIKPLLLIMDEPFSALDYATTHMLRDTILHVAKRYSLTILFICHDLDEALYLGDYAVFLSHRPTVVLQSMTVTGPETRDVLWTTTPEFMALKKRALEIIQETVAP